ncbi:unnamed protein product [Diabrotica balteata]|uniref:Uncharacterized protein n=1 Tax=Diabrotica balteata TaxID=107213 RepID=A0A9P0DX87_DIABA|nr:unnamed protein product [Diabrotica balteata]
MMRRYSFSVCLVLFSVTTIWSYALDSNDGSLRSLLLNQNNEQRYSNKNNFFHYNDGLNGQYSPCGASPCQPEIDIYNGPCGGSVCQPGMSSFPMIPQIPPIPQIQPIIPQIPPIPPIPQFQPIIPPIPPIPQIQPVFPSIPPIPPIPQIQPIIPPIPPIPSIPQILPSLHSQYIHNQVSVVVMGVLHIINKCR